MTGIEKGSPGVSSSAAAGSGTAAISMAPTPDGSRISTLNGLSWSRRTSTPRSQVPSASPAVRLGGRRRVLQPGDRRASVGQAFSTKTAFTSMSGRSKSPKSVQDATRRLVAESVRTSIAPRCGSPTVPSRSRPCSRRAPSATCSRSRPARNERAAIGQVRRPRRPHDVRMLLTWMNGRRVGPHARR
jgi:hypothetical protein